MIFLGERALVESVNASTKICFFPGMNMFVMHRTHTMYI